VTSYRRGRTRLRDEGPRLLIRIGHSEFAESALRRTGSRVPEPIEVTALIDTGSGRSIIQNDVVQALGLTPVGAVEIDTPSSTDMPAMEYYVRFWFDRKRNCEVTALEAPLPVPEVRALLGRDVLSEGRLVYEGQEGGFSLELG
jgi:hypothetical protein